MSNKLRRGQLTHKDMSTMREADIAKVQRDRKQGELRDYSLQHKAELFWDLNDEAKRDRICKLVIDDNIELYLDAEQLMRYLRWV